MLYFNELQKWNKKINLIGPASDKEIIENHFLDSLALLSFLPHDQQTSFLDVGSGAGFPGLVLKISQPQLAVTLVEPRQKRVAFLKHICRATRCQGVNVVCQRLGEGKDQEFIASYGSFSLITCRALSRITPFLKMVEPLLNPSGRIVCMKGPRAESELAEWQEAKLGNLSLLDSHKFILPFSLADREILVFGRQSPVEES